MRLVLSLSYIALMAMPAVEGAFKVSTIYLEKPTTFNNTRLIPILVGGSALTFTPNSVVAQPGDVLQFQFGARNHTVTQSAQQSPCQPLANGGVNSGFIPFDGGASGVVGTFDVPVMNNQPMWLYCAQGTHCQAGMVLAVNSPSSSDLIAYADLASRQAANIPAAQVQGGVAASIPLANAIVPKGSNATSGQMGSPMTGSRPSGTATATVTGAPKGGGTATVFTTVVVGPSGTAAGNRTGRTTARPALATGASVPAGAVNGSLANAGSPSRVPSSGGGSRLEKRGLLVSVVLSAVAAALGTLLLTVAR